MFIHEHEADDVWNKLTLNPWLSSEWFIFFACPSCAVLQHFSIQSNWRECVGGALLRWLLPLSLCQQLLLCIEFCKELRSSQTNAELWLCPWRVVTALIIYPFSSLPPTPSSWSFEAIAPKVASCRRCPGEGEGPQPKSSSISLLHQS